MQDIKYLTKEKKSFLRRLLEGRRGGKPNLRRRLAESPRKKLRLRVLLPFIALMLGLWPLYNLISSAVKSLSAVQKADAKSSAPTKLSSLDIFQSLQVSADLVRSARVVEGKLESSLPDGGKVIYNLDPTLQEKVSHYLAERRVPYAVFVAIEPKTGRILGMVSHSTVDPEWHKKACYQIYPMASLFKIVTASAALGQNKVSPDTVIAFNGKLTSVNPRYWDPRGRRSPEMTLTDAMGKSVNPVFGRLASTAVPPQNDAELQLMGAGLGREVKISPIHAAAMMGAVANRGLMMTPLLADKVTSGTGEVLFSAAPLELRRLLSEEATAKLAQTLSTTVNKGTSRRAFHDRRGRALLAKLNIAAKTGSIDGKEPEGQYSWFAAYAPMEDPQIALVALVVNQGKWNIKAANVGEKALEAFFR